MSWRRLAKTVLALRGSGGIKAGKGSPPARALGAHAFFALPAALRIPRKTNCCGCSPVVPSPRRAAATAFFPFFWKPLQNTCRNQLLFPKSLSEERKLLWLQSRGPLPPPRLSKFESILSTRRLSRPLKQKRNFTKISFEAK